MQAEGFTDADMARLAECVQEATALLRAHGLSYWADALQEGRDLLAEGERAGVMRVRGVSWEAGDLRDLVVRPPGGGQAATEAVRERLGQLQQEIGHLTWKFRAAQESPEAPPAPTVWPPPIQGQWVPPAPTNDFPVTDDPIKIARHRVALGWTFVALSVFAPPVFLPYAYFYGWQAWRMGEARPGGLILTVAIGLTCLAGVGAALAYLHNLGPVSP